MQNDRTQTGLDQSSDSHAIDRTDFFADAFDFYGIGQVNARKVSPLLRDIGGSTSILIFRITGDELGTFAVGINSSLVKSSDGLSMLTEVANIAIGKFISQWADATSASIDLSPPEFLLRDQRQHRLLLTALSQAQAPEGSVLRTYDIKFVQGLDAIIHIAFLASNEGVS